MGAGKHSSQGSQALNLKESRTERKKKQGRTGQCVSEGRGCERAFLRKATSSRRWTQRSRQWVHEAFTGLQYKHHTSSQLYIK